MDNFKKNLHQDIKKNIISTKDGLFLQAGAHQFQSFWTRDFCWASLGLISIGEYEVVKNHLQVLLNNMNQDGLIPRILETGNSAKTVVLNTVFRFLPYTLRKNKSHKKIKAEHLGEHDTLSIDSNALVLISALEYIKASRDQEFLDKNKDKFLKCFLFYKTRINDGLIYQEAYEDWQDSAKRFGKTFYTNLLYFQAVKMLKEARLIDADLESLKNKIHQTFYRKGIYHSFSSGDHISLEGNYLALIWSFASDKELLWEKLESAAYQKQGFPIASYPNYPSNQISWTTKIVGLSHYHDDMLWSWIYGLKLKAMNELKIDSENYLKKIEYLFRRDKGIFEIYSPYTSLPIKNPFYLSESPFSWGIGINLWALST